jgi:thioredoxin 1
MSNHTPLGVDKSFKKLYNYIKNLNFLLYMDNNMMNKEDMNMSSSNTPKIIGGIVAAVILLGGIGYLVNGQNAAQKAKDEASAMMKKTEDAAMMKKKEAEAMMKKTEGDAMMKKEDGTMMKKEGEAMTSDAMSKAGVFTTYAPDALTKTEGHKNVIFFSATWCPTCQATNKDIQANLGNIDPKLHILSADYDTSTELKAKYGVTMQHTFVVVDGNGNLIKKTNGLATVAAINTYAFAQ